MNRCKTIALIVSLIMVFSSVTSADENLSVLPGKIGEIKRNEMMNHYLRGLAQQEFENWKEEYENRDTPEQIAEYQNRLHEKFIEAIGGLPERTPLNPQITGTISREGYKVEKVIFESQPKFYVTAALFLPDCEKYKPPYPGVIGGPAGIKRHSGIGLRPD
jgi:hypothetical protein